LSPHAAPKSNNKAAANPRPKPTAAARPTKAAAAAANKHNASLGFSGVDFIGTQINADVADRKQNQR
jgi:hypothetical protein